MADRRLFACQLITAGLYVYDQWLKESYLAYCIFDAHCLLRSNAADDHGVL